MPEPDCALTALGMTLTDRIGGGCSIPCPLCGWGNYKRSTGLNEHIIRHHGHLNDWERSNVIHEWMAQGGRR